MHFRYQARLQLSYVCCLRSASLQEAETVSHRDWLPGENILDEAQLVIINNAFKRIHKKNATV